MTKKQLLKLDPGDRVNYTDHDPPDNTNGTVKSNNGEMVVVRWDDGCERPVAKKLLKHMRKIK